MTLRRIGPIALLLPLLLAGCDEPLTQVVLVIQSDFSPPIEVDGFDVASIPGPYAPLVNPFFDNVGVTPTKFPLSVGFLSGGKTNSFSITARLFKNVRFGTPTLAVSRTVTDIPFESHETMMLVLPLLKACACQGSTCPAPGVNPDCDNLNRPMVVPFDPAVAPPSSGMGAIGVGGGGGPVFDAGMATPTPQK